MKGDFMKRLIGVAVMFACAGTAQTVPSIKAAYARETVVTGTAAAGSGITILNVQFPAAAKIGSGTVARDGSFAIAISAPLVEGHGLVAVDQTGVKSQRFNVSPARSGDTPAKPPAK